MEMADVVDNMALMAKGMDMMKIGLGGGAKVSCSAESTSARAAGVVIDVSVERVRLPLFLLLSGACGSCGGWRQPWCCVVICDDGLSEVE